LILSPLGLSEILPSALWGLENGLDVFVVAKDVDIAKTEHWLMLQRLRAAGITVLTEVQFIAELEWTVA
jgi:hypothetical protein